MAILNFPDLTPQSAEFGLVSNSQTFTSPLSGTSQTLELPGARWRAQVQFEGLDGDDRRSLQAFLIQLRGQAGRFYYGDPGYLAEGPGGTAAAGTGPGYTGQALVNGASQTGGSLITDQWKPNDVVLKAGDYISFNTLGDVHRELHMVTADVTADGSGNATLPIEAPIRTAPADNAAITVTGATCVMRLTGDEQTNWAMGRGPLFADVTLEMVEAFTDAS